ncbi:hypothetical protein FOXG_19068 [Fusarium oxysporum f. sp. lycopersici 4287]|uniref:Uncharacterized protein n=2 Tax=Fusarium oxysporum TaxID=5507 RepID=A0A0J9UW63_FUSO4|nr:hypothetical protein FOXG_19068 [Fusarium oxysporum f. sp. lycopersici 4287]XP_018240785.1 hypothetical protein FOXG_19068 [Fusarium oxysporum f. sp. lycopersici 4287]XP_018240786.1 hypothetical protein FOXG_19068 [Fusarium oxysporum f. sp. lycopersici 4287]EXK39699.1 hypothetical protein FOMG_06899 [Fusarium oxysporum f. sp. melonis 26406]EXK39700.1 hypothetical protein FOMG_06899 [Fusarium oxysporum f. sp. melonis 26406]EXK39701.1 hypothetical protein FOMG_06899 [Fusarium oxysporum f. sp.
MCSLSLVSIASLSFLNDEELPPPPFPSPFRLLDNIAVGLLCRYSEAVATLEVFGSGMPQWRCVCWQSLGLSSFTTYVVSVLRPVFCPPHAHSCHPIQLFHGTKLPLRTLGTICIMR